MTCWLVDLLSFFNRWIICLPGVIYRNKNRRKNGGGFSGDKKIILNANRAFLFCKKKKIMAISLAHATLFSRTSLFLSRNSRSLAFCIPFSTSSSSSAASAASSSLPSDKLHRNKWRSPVASVLELGGVKIGREGNSDTQLKFFS